MAKSAKMKVRRVGTKEDRKRPSVFVRLKTDEQFRGHALFEPDPELEDNPGFYEYFSHWDQQGNTYVPCAGEKCPFCASNDNPGTQAATLWFFPENDKKDQLKVFTMNITTTRDMTDIAEEEEGVLGKKFRIKRISDKGEYRIRPLTEKPLKKTEIKALLKTAPNLEEMIERQLKAQWERLKAMEALADDDDDDDDDDDEEETPKGQKARRGKSKAEKEEPEDDDDDDEDDDEDEDDDDDESDDDDDDSEDDDDDDDDDSDDDDSDDDDEVSELKGAKLTVVKFDEAEEIFSVKDDDNNKFNVWLSEGVEVDSDKVKKGIVITVDAVKDEEGDYVATKVVLPKADGKGKGKGGKGSSKKK